MATSNHYISGKEFCVSLTLRMIVPIILIMANTHVIGGQSDDSNTLTYTYIEEQVSNSLVGDIKADAGLLYSPEVMNQLRFSFMEESEFFMIEATTGLLRTSRIIDRDSICSRYQRECIETFDVAIQPVLYFQVINVKVKILDINDNVPVFPMDVMSLEISESTVVGATFALPIAEDADSGRFGTQTYRLGATSGASKFDLRIHNNPGGDPDVHLVLSQSLDRETENAYLLVVIAEDGGTPRQTGSLTIDVTVSDVNDNTPRFTNGTYDVAVYEDVEVGVTIARVIAEDPDEGPNGQVSYVFSRSTESSLGNYFGINSGTGDIFVRNALDYEHAGEYVLNVIAVDQGANALSAYTRVTVRVWDVNDHSPLIRMSYLSSSGRAEVLENAPSRTFVAFATVDDPDSGQNGIFSCSLDSTDFLLQPMNEKQFQILTDAIFDRELRDTYVVNFVCVDSGAQPRTSSETITVSVRDENDHPPEFPETIYTVDMLETNSLQLALIEVSADDDDIDENGKIRYSIIGDGDFQDSLRIDPVSGLVTTNDVFDYEKQVQYEYTIIAEDMGNPSKNSTASLILNLQDVNDNPPKFSTNHTKFASMENQNIGTEIGEVRATDVDGPGNNVVSYRIDPTKGDARVFAIDPLLGTITTRQLLDREVTPSYDIVIIAENRDTPMRTSLAVTIDIGDQNDNAPIFLYPINGNETVTVLYDVKVGDVVSQVEAMDRDAGVNADLRYEIVAGASDELFDINPMDGTIYINKEPKNFKQSVVKVRLIVSDQGFPPMSSMTELTFNVEISKGLDIIIVIIVGCVFGLIVIVGLIVLMTMLVLRHRRHQELTHAKYNCRVEASRVMMNAPPQTIVNAPALASPGTPQSEAGSTHSTTGKGGVNFNPDVIQDHGYRGNAGWGSDCGDLPDVQQDPRMINTTHSTFHKPPPKLPPRDPLPNDAKYPENGNPPPYSSMAPDVAANQGRFSDEHRYRVLYQANARYPDENSRTASASSSPSLTEVRLQAGDLFDLIPSHSASQGDRLSDRVSLTDSGRGGSEEGDHPQYSPGCPTPSTPSHHGSPDGNGSRCVPSANQPTKFKAYPCPSQNKNRSTSDHSSSNSATHSLPPKPRSHSSHKQHGSTDDVMIANDVTNTQRKNRRPQNRDPCSTFKSPARQTADGPVPGRRATRGSTDRQGSSMHHLPQHGSNNSLPSVGRRDIETMDCMSDDDTTTSGSYTIDLEDGHDRLGHVQTLHISHDVMV